MSVDKLVDRERRSETTHSPVLWKAIHEVAQLESRLHHAEEQWVSSMLLAADLRDDETCQHIQRMSRYTETLFRTTSDDSQHARLMRLASQLHDIGKLGIRDDILLKVGPLAKEEVEVMRGHTVLGRDILQNVQSEVADLAASIALSHHERWDGGGYPHGLSGDDIPEAARMAAVADAFDALTTNRIYRKAYSVPKALQMMRAERGRQFDPDLLDAFFGSIDHVMDIFNKYPDEGLLRGATG